MTAEVLLKYVKESLSITGTHLDNTIQHYIDEVKGYLIDAGVPNSVVDDTVAAGVIARGVADLWNYGNGDTKLSEYFYQRAAQLRKRTMGGETV